MQTKKAFREFLKTKIRSQFCIYDKICVKKLFTLIRDYQKPIAYKYNKGSQLFYKQTNKNMINILLYIPLQSEVNIYHILQKLLKHKKYYVFVPKVEKKDFNMVKYRLPLSKNNFHINEPVGNKIYNNRIIDIAIIPVLGADKELKRIGFGKGMYDRFYAKLKIKPYSIFVSRFLRISNYSLCDWYDIEADKYVSTYR